MKATLILLSLAMSLRYLIWRAAYTLNEQGSVLPVASALLFAAEVYGFISMLFLIYQAFRPAESPVSPGVEEKALPSVDVFVTVYDEPAEILYRTLICCLGVDYPRDRLDIHVLDDGPRDAVRAMAERLGCRYLARPDRRHAKAGNLNHGLEHSTGEMILVLDCDHLPASGILKETVGFFKDPAVAFVQLPHHFYNPDIFQRQLHPESALVHEQDFFFHVIQPGRGRGNAVIFAGSSAVLRRSSLESVGGFQYATAIEDAHTGMRLHAKGYRGIYYPKVLSTALSPETFRGHQRQRQRWTRGGVQLFRLDNPLFRGGLSFPQRLHYLASTLHCFQGWARLIYLGTPLTSLLSGQGLIVADLATLLGYFLPHYILGYLAFLQVSGRHRSPFWSEIYETATAFSLSWTAAEALFRPGKLIFKVTPKGEVRKSARMEWAYIAPHMILAAFLFAGFLWAAYQVSRGRLDEELYVINSIWAIYNLVLLGSAMGLARERPERRGVYRVERSIPCELSFPDGKLSGTIRNISETGLAVLTKDDAPLPDILRVSIPDTDRGPMELDARVLHQRRAAGGGVEAALAFSPMPEGLRGRLIRLIFSPPGPATRPRGPSLGSALWMKIALPAALLALFCAYAVLPTHRLIQEGLAAIALLGYWGPVAYLLFIAAGCVLALPPTPFIIVAGALFGLGHGFAYALLGTSLGAALAFLTGRTLLGKKLVSPAEKNWRLRVLERIASRDGWKIILLARLAPLCPFNLMAYAFGAARTPFRHFLAAETLGAIPLTFLYCYLGSLTIEIKRAVLIGGEGSPERRFFWLIGLLASLAALLVMRRVFQKGWEQLAEDPSQRAS